MNHSWKELQAWGVSPGSGRSWGVDQEWVCTRCGARKGRGPQSLMNGRRVIRWWWIGPDGRAYEGIRARPLWGEYELRWVGGAQWAAVTGIPACTVSREEAAEAAREAEREEAAEAAQWKVAEAEYFRVLEAHRLADA